MARTADVVIIGGGVIGCSIAYELAKRGVGCVVLEKERIGWAASGATAGIIGPLWYVDRAIGPYFKLGMRSLEMFPTLAAELKDAGVDPEFRQAGILKPALTEELYSTLHENLPWQQGLGLGVEWLSREAILDREPELTPAVLGGVFSPQEGHVRGEALARSMAHAAARLGAHVLEGAEVAGIDFDARGKATGVRTLTETWSAGHVVLAAGAWTGTAQRWMPEAAPVRPIKGQRLTIRKLGFAPKSVVQSLIPQADGTIMIGATRQEGVFDHSITVDGISQMAVSAATVFPILADAEFVLARSGVRPGSPDGVPIIGPVPGHDGLSLATGHDHAGVMLSPGTGELVAEFIVSGDAGPLAPFNVARFASPDASKRTAARTLFTNTSAER